VKNGLALISKVAEEAIAGGRPFVQIEDLSNVPGASLEARKYFIDYMKKREQRFLGLISCGASPTLKVSIKLGKRLNIVKYDVEIVNSHSEAIRLAVKMLSTGKTSEDEPIIGSAEKDKVCPVSGAPIIGRPDRLYVERIKEWYRDHPFRMLVVYGANRFLRAAINVARPFLPFRLRLAKDLDSALKLVAKEKSEITEPSPIPTTRGVGSEPLAPDQAQQYADELLRFIGDINWETDGVVDSTQVDPSHPFRPVFDAIALVKNDLDGLFQEHKRAEEALKSSEERLRILFEFAPDAYYLNDVKGAFIDGNRAAEKLVGRKKNELIGQSFLKLGLLPLDQIPKAAALLAKNALGRPTGPDELVLNRRDGTLVPVEISTFPVKVEGQTLVLGIARDITERKRAGERVRASLREKEVLLQEIHHRVKNNLQVICSLLRLQSRNIKDEEALAVFRDSQNRIRSMALIHEKLYRSQDLARVDFGGYIRSLASSLIRSYRTHSGRVRLQVDVSDVSLPIDAAVPCGLIINELVTNSLKHAFPGGRKGEIRVMLRSNHDHQVTLTVGDNGVGLPQDVDPEDTQPLGLELVNALVEQVAGRIDLRNDGGTEFEIRFPAS